MFIDYIILAIISAGTLIWACRQVPGGNEPPARGDGDGGLPVVGGDTYPSGNPPTLADEPARDGAREEEEHAPHRSKPAPGAATRGVAA